MGLQGHSGRFVYSKDPVMVVPSLSEEMSQPPLPLNVSLLSAYHPGVTALTGGFAECTENITVTYTFNHSNFLSEQLFFP